MKKQLLLIISVMSSLLFVMQGGIASAAINYNNIIDDAVFDNANTMTADQIDSFLNTFPNSCISTNNGFSAPDVTGYSPSTSFKYGDLVSAGTIISHAAQAYGINPQVLLTTLQKEQGLVKGDGPNIVRSGPDMKNCGPLVISASVGYNCPDALHLSDYSGFTLYAYRGTPITAVSQTCVESASYVGFSRQIIIAAWQFTFDRHRSEGQNNWYVNKSNWDNSDDLNFCYSHRTVAGGPFYLCPDQASHASDPYVSHSGQYPIDDIVVTIENGATAALYNYTPHKHGQELFTDIFTGWFGAPYLTINISYPGADNSVDNSGDLANIPVVLSRPPLSSVQLNYGVSNPSMAKIVGRSSLIFTPSNWNIPQNIVVQGLGGSASSQNFNLGVLYINSPDGAYSQSITPYLAQLPMFWSNTSESAVLRLHNASTGKHAYAVSANEISSLQNNGYSVEATLGYQCRGSANPALDVENSINLVRPIGSSDIPNPSFSSPTILASDLGDLQVGILKNSAGTNTVLSSSSAEINSLVQSGYTQIASVLLCNQGMVPVYRLYDPVGNTHFNTISASEASNTLGLGFRFEGISFYNSPTNTLPVYRLYDPVGNTHFYTSSWAESSAVQRIGFRYEGVAWYAGTSSAPVYRLYDPVGNTHFYTSSWAEISAVQRIGFRYEGVAWYAK